MNNLSYIVDYMIQNELPCILKNPFFQLESEIRCVLINSFFKKGVAVWNCQGEAGKCPDPIFINNIPMRIAIGDVPIRYNERFYIIEIKFQNFFCKKVKIKSGFMAVRDSAQIIEAQSKMILSGGGFLVIISEPPPKTVGINGFLEPDRKICEAQLIKSYKMKIANNNVPYNVWILDQQRFIKYWDEFLSNASIKTVKRNLVTTISRSISYKQLEKIIPEAKTTLTMQDIRNGKIVDLILNIINKSKDINK